MTKCKVLPLQIRREEQPRHNNIKSGNWSCTSGAKVLLVDADPQGDLTTALGWTNADSLPITLDTQ